MITEQDNLSDITSLRSKLVDAMLPSHFVMVHKSSGLMFSHFLDDDVNCEPRMLSSVFVRSALTILAFVLLSASVPHKVTSHIIGTEFLSSASKLANCSRSATTLLIQLKIHLVNNILFILILMFNFSVAFK